MIVVDENLSDTRIIDAISKWQPGQVLPINSLRPRSIIKDDAVPTLLQRVDQPTFVTINVSDYWKRAEPHSKYCIVCVAVPQDHAIEALELLRPFLRSASFRSKSDRMGRIFRLLASHVEYYTANRKIQSFSWIDTS